MTSYLYADDTATFIEDKNERELQQTSCKGSLKVVGIQIFLAAFAEEKLVPFHSKHPCPMA